MTKNAFARFGTDQLILGGFFAGATLAVTTLIRLRDRGEAAFKAGLLQFGTYDLSGQTPSGRRIANEYFLDAYAGSAPDRTDPDISPIFADLTELPPVLIVIGSDDILLEDNLTMAARLSAAGVSMKLGIYPKSPHGFTGHPTPMAAAATRNMDKWLRTQIHS